MTLHELKLQKKRLETMWLKLRNEIEECGPREEECSHYLSDAQDQINYAIHQINWQIGQRK